MAAPEPREEGGGAEAGGGPDAPPAPPTRRVVPGVLYLGHLPPGLGPRELRGLLGAHGELGRVFVQPLGGGGPRGRRRGSRRGGPRGRGWAEAWLEFRDKRAAKMAALMLGGAPLGARARHLRHLRWNLRYLPGFRWPHLSERLAQERAAAAARRRAEAAGAKRRGAAYARNARRGQDFARRDMATAGGGADEEHDMAASRGGDGQHDMAGDRDSDTAAALEEAAPTRKMASGKHKMAAGGASAEDADVMAAGGPAVEAAAPKMAAPAQRRPWGFTQRPTESERRRGAGPGPGQRRRLLHRIFPGAA